MYLLPLLYWILKVLMRKILMPLPADQDLVDVAAEEEAEYQTIPQMEKAISKIKKEMEKAARDLDFMEAARLRDNMFSLQKKLTELKN